VAARNPEEPAPGFVLALPKAISALEDCRLALLAYLRPLHIEERTINRIEVVLEELVTNVVRHSSEATCLQVMADPSDGGLRICVEDDGEAFNPLAAEERGPFGKLEDAPLGGLGIVLVRRLSRSVEYSRVGSNNRICATIAV
jgi:serine/threonine-protein kinase RsbW